MAQSDPDQIAKLFAEHYYATFGSNRPGLGALYQANAYLTFEGDRVQGVQAIVEKFNRLPFQKCAHRVDSMDAQLSPAGGLIVFVTGAIQPEGEQNHIRFSQTFHLSPMGSNWVVTNDLFRLNLG